MNKNSSPGFLEVSINSEKLSDVLSNIQKTITDQAFTIDEMNKRLVSKITQTNSITEKIIIDVNKNQKEVKQMIVNEVRIQRDDLKKSNEKTQFLFQTLHGQIKAINAAILQDKTIFEDLFNKAQFAFQESKQIKVLKSIISNLETEINSLKSQSFKKNIEQQIEKSQEKKVGEICQDTFFKIIQNDRVREIIQKKEYISMNGKNNAIKAIEQKQALFQASVSAKLGKLEQKLMDNNSIELNKVLYPSKNGAFFNSTANSTKTYSFSPELSKDIKQELQNNTTIKEINKKLENIGQEMKKKIEVLKTEMTKSFEKNEFVNEKINIVSKKLQKQKSRINDLSFELKKNAEKKLDDKIVESFRYEIRQKTLDYENNLEGKLSKDYFEKEKSKLNERIKIIHENLTEKSDKFEIKKAITFLQSKIKEIIFLVAGSFDQDREGSIKKMPLKCLSCDKDLDTNLLKLQEKCKSSVMTPSGEGKNLKRSESAVKLRCATSRMRKHNRLNSGVVSPVVQTQTASFGLD